MNNAIEQARLCKIDVPVGCVIKKDGTIIASAYNMREEKQDIAAHAEILAIKQAQERLSTSRLKGCELFVTLEPCLLCMGALLKKGISSLFYVLDDEKLGSLSHYHAFVDDRLQVLSLEDNRFKPLMDQFFQSLRKESEKP